MVHYGEILRGPMMPVKCRDGADSHPTRAFARAREAREGYPRTWMVKPVKSWIADCSSFSRWKSSQLSVQL